MQINEALNALNDGHTIWKVGYAKRVCKALRIPFMERELVQRFRSDWSPDNYKGITMKDGCEGSLGVDSGDLSYYVAKQFGVANRAKEKIGRGSQARAYAEVVREAVESLSKMKGGEVYRLES